MDLAADSTNTAALKFYSIEEDSLSQDWTSLPPREWAWCNPPFSHIQPWVKKAYESKQRIVMLLPASVGANWWRDWVHNKARILCLNGRITFGGCTQSYPKDCVLLQYAPYIIPAYKIWSWNEDVDPVAPE